MTSPLFSFEFFPPKTEEGLKKLLLVRDELTLAKPAFFSVTYGAGGSTRAGTLNTVLAVRETGVETAPHLSCVGDIRENIRERTEDYQAKNIKRLVVLRGDLPSGMGASNDGDFRYANELVTFIRQETGDHFTLEVAAYPEGHPQAISPSMDFTYFKQKVAAGANSAITQYFYNADAYFAFIDRCSKAQINIPIIPGIMPITNYDGLVRFSSSCGADIPLWIRKQLEEYANQPDDLLKFGEEVVSRLCQNLLAQGAPGLHFYTLNQAKPSLAICRNLTA